MKSMTVSKALKWLFIAQILSILSFIPVVGGILVIIAIVMELLALGGAGRYDGDYRKAFLLSIAGIVLNVVDVFVDSTLLDNILSILFALISLAVLYYVCAATVRLLRADGADHTARRGELVWKINLCCTVVSVVLSVVAFIPIVGALASVLGFIVFIAEFVGYILYMVFLYQSSMAL